MKKQIINKVLFACLIMAMSGFVLNLHAQADIVLEFTNPDGADYGSSNDGFLGVGLGGSGSGATAEGKLLAADDPYVKFEFSIAATGQIGLDVSTAAKDQVIIDVLDTWDNSNIGSTTNDELKGKSFSLILTAESRMQLGKDVDGNRGGIGIRGENQRRIDDTGDDTEWMEFELEGDVGIDFVRFGYNDVSADDKPHAIVKDHDTDKYIELIEGVDGNPHPEELYIDGAEYNMRYFTDILHFTKADSLDEGGYRLYSLEFNVVAPEPKPPAIVSTTPADGDSLTMDIGDDYIIQFDGAMDQAATSAAVSITPAVSNRADTWNAEGKELTISFDDLDYDTWYEVVVGTGAKGTNDLNMLEADTLTFKTLPEPPSVVSTFPENLAVEVPIDSPISIEFSKSMIPDSVEKAISFNPELSDLSFAWGEDNTALVVTSAVEMMPSTMYFATVGTVATDEFGVQMAEPFLFAFTTSIATSVENNSLSDAVIYPNPASDLILVSGVEVASVKIYSLTGQLLKESYNSAVIRISDVEAGSYMVTVTDIEDNKVTKMIVIE